MSKKVSMNEQVKGRRRVALANLEAQLRSGVKTLSTSTAKKYEGMVKGQTVALTADDRKRIEDVIHTLEGRI